MRPGSTQKNYPIPTGEICSTQRPVLLFRIAAAARRPLAALFACLSLRHRPGMSYPLPWTGYSRLRVLLSDAVLLYRVISGSG